MNELSPKQQFFNQYRGQSVFYLDGLSKPKTFPFDTLMDGDYVLLRSVNQLTDDEYMEVADLCGWIKGGNINHFIDTGKECIEHFLQDFHLSVMAYQYLLYIGVLLPFTYLNENNNPITLQPDELIKLGWAKLK